PPPQALPGGCGRPFIGARRGAGGGAYPVTSGPPPSSPCRPWRPARPASPWRCGSPRCWGPRPGGSPGRSAGTRGPASRRSRPPPAGRCPWPRRRPPPPPRPARTLRDEGAICSSSVMLLRSGSPARPNSCWVMVIFSRASSESAHTKPRLTTQHQTPRCRLSPARRSACSRCGPISPEPAPGRHSGPRQTRSHWRRGPAWRLPPRPGSGS
uniref:Uncharacterized protein n=1 Tax=Anas platyrhynchos platyrhynchos TaxID=8840 RepID=A0A493T7R1_ANAPP